MGQVNKKAKEQILKMMLQEVPTEEIARKLHFAVGTIRNVFEESTESIQKLVLQKPICLIRLRM